MTDTAWRPARPKWVTAAGCCLLLGLAGHLGAQPLASDCPQAWRDYNEFKRRTTMEAAQYPLTAQGDAVRAACGLEALPVPPGSDNPRRLVVRPKHKPAPPADSGKPAPPTSPSVKPH